MRRIRDKLANLPVGYRILMGNSLFIMAGALGTMWVTQYCLAQANFLPLLLFVLGIIGLSLLVNVWILRACLRPPGPLPPAGGRKARKDPQTVVVTGLDVNHLAAALDLLRHHLDAHAQAIEAQHHQLYALSGQVLGAQVASARSRLEPHTGHRDWWRARAASAREEERQRIARELGNEASQVLAALLTDLEVVEDSIPDQWVQTRARLAAIRNLAAQTLKGVQQLVSDLDSSLPDDEPSSAR